MEGGFCDGSQPETGAIPAGRGEDEPTAWLDEEPGRAVHPCLLPGLVSCSCEAAEIRVLLFSHLRKSRGGANPFDQFCSASDELRR